MKSFKSYVENRDLNEMARVSSSTFPEKVADPRIQQENEMALEKCIKFVQHALDDNSQAYNNLWKLKFPDDTVRGNMLKNGIVFEIDKIHRAMMNHIGMNIKVDTAMFTELSRVLSALNERRDTYRDSFIEEGDINNETIRARHYDDDYRSMVKTIIQDLESMERMLLRYKHQNS